MFDRKKFAALQTATPQELGVPESPCVSCPNSKQKGGCHKPVNPDAATACRKWAEWNCEIWALVTERIRKAAGK